MKEGFYTDPQSRRFHPSSKIAVVITFYDAGKKQYAEGVVDSKFDTLMMNLEAHQHFDPGVPYDIVIVDHGPGELHFPDEPMYTILRRENFGYSFGGWKQAWEHLGTVYDYYCFCEDDIAPTKDGWLLEILLKFLSAGDIGAVGNFVEARSVNENGSALAWKATGMPARDMMYNLDGGYTFTSSRVLEEVERARILDGHTGLVVKPVGEGSPFHGTTNEIIFQHPILELGYRIDSFADGEHFLVHGSEIYSNDLMHRSGPFAPLLNLNGRHRVPELKELFAFLETT